MRRSKMLVAFERVVLIPLDVLFTIWAISSFVHKDWLAGVVFVVSLLGTGAIGQALHPHLSAGELARARQFEEADKPESQWALPHADSFLLAKGAMRCSFLCAVSSGVVWVHWGHRLLGGLVVGAAAGAGVLLVVFVVIGIVGLVTSAGGKKAMP